MPDYGSFLEAFFAMQRVLPEIIKGSEADQGPRGVIKYADLKTVSDAIWPKFGEFGFVWSTQPTVDDGKPVLRYELTHLSHTADNPQQRTGLYPIFGDNKPQALGAAITYARRYALCAVVGLTPDKEEDAEGRPARGAKTMSMKKPAATKPAPDPDAVPGVPLPGEPADRITQPQQRAIFAQLRELGIPESGRHAAVNKILADAGLEPILSFTGLSVASGKLIYDHFKREIELRTTGAEKPHDDSN